MKKLIIRMIIVAIVVAIIVTTVITLLRKEDDDTEIFVALSDYEQSTEYTSTNEKINNIINQDMSYYTSLEKMDISACTTTNTAIFDIYSYYKPYLQFSSAASEGDLDNLRALIEAYQAKTYGNTSSVNALATAYITTRSTASNEVRYSMFQAFLTQYISQIKIFYELAKAVKSYAIKYTLGSEFTSVKCEILDVEDMLINLAITTRIDQSLTTASYRRFNEITATYLARFAGKEVTADIEIQATTASYVENATTYLLKDKVRSTLTAQKTVLDIFYTNYALIDEAAYFANSASEQDFSTYYFLLTPADQEIIMPVNNYLTIILPTFFTTGENAGIYQTLSEILV